jgi:ferritin
MISQKMNDLLNRQIQKEFYSAYLYLGFEAYFKYENLDGFANFFHVQVQEERDHALKFFNYVTEAGGKVELLQIAEPDKDPCAAEDIFARTLEHEREVTKSIYNLVDNALQERDHGTNTFLQWFVTEQVEEEATVEKVLRKLQMIKNDPHGILLLDAELAQRVYTPPAVGTI